MWSSGSWTAREAYELLVGCGLVGDGNGDIFSAVKEVSVMNKQKKVRYPNALLAAARSAELRMRVVPDKTKYKRSGRGKKTWMVRDE